MSGPRLFRKYVCRRILAAISVSFALGASHPQEMTKALERLRRDEIAAAMQPFEADAHNPNARNRLLYLYELGALQHWSGGFEQSAQCFLEADACAREQEQAAVISVGRTAQNAAAAIINDNVRSYEPPVCERVMSRTLNALNYLLKGDLEGAAVEVRKAEEYQRRERQRHEKAVVVAQESARVKAAMAQKALQSNLQAMDLYAAGLRNSFENPFTYFLASQVFLAQGADGYNDAWVEVQQALAGGVLGLIHCDLSPYASGVYFYRVEAKSALGTQTVTKKFAVVK